MPCHDPHLDACFHKLYASIVIATITQCPHTPHDLASPLSSVDSVDDVLTCWLSGHCVQHLIVSHNSFVIPSTMEVLTNVIYSPIVAGVELKPQGWVMLLSGVRIALIKRAAIIADMHNVHAGDACM